MASYPAPPPPTTNGPSHWDLVGEWMMAEGGALLRQHDGKVSQTDLVEHLLQQVIRQSDMGPHAADKARNAISWNQIKARAREKAQYLLDSYRPTYRPRFSKTQASKGGKSSKRPSALLEALRGMEWQTLSLTEIAAELHCHVRTASKLRQKLKDEPDFLDQVMADIDAESDAIASVSANQPEAAAIASVRANSVAANNEWQAAAAPVAANNPIVDIATKRPLEGLEYLEQKIQEIQAQREQNAYDHAADMLAIIGL